tara:strand:+ start:4 stop:246 length:243 start_codon:yes stop_codon:yes gene_type:complete
VKQKKTTLQKNKLQKGDLVKRMIASHYTDHIRSDAFGVVLSVFYPVARVYFYDTNREEVWNQTVLELVSKKTMENHNESR